MDCNLVFVALTAGPFPTGRQSDVAIERHLIACGACRRLAEALRPHDEESHESLTAIERVSLPRYRGVGRPVTALASAAPSGALSAASSSARPSSSDWRRELSTWAPEPQVASFSLAPRRRTATAVEALSMLATLAAAAVAFWCLGVLAL
jgi:hypothetical protein